MPGSTTRGRRSATTTVAWVAGAYACAAGLVTLLGWAANLPRLTDWKDDGISMFPNTATCAVLSGLVVVLLTFSTRRSRMAARALASLLVLLGGLTLVEHVIGVDLGIDTLLFNRPWGQAAAAAPMRMGPPSSLSFLTAGVAALLATLGGSARRVAAVLAVAIVVLGSLSMTGHLYGAAEMFFLPRLTGIAMQAASIIVPVGIGLLANIPEQEPMRTLLEPTAAGALARRALPVIVVLSLAFGAGQLYIEQNGFVEVPFGTAMSTILEVGLLVGLLWWAVAWVRSHEQALRASESEVRRKAGQLAGFLDTAAIALHRVGPDGRILWVNEAELRMLGYRADEYLGHDLADFYVDPGTVADILRRLHRGEKLYEYPAQMKCKNGSVKDVLIDSTVFWNEGRFVHTQCFTRDVTDRKSAEEARALYASIIESSDDAIVSKDLNGIITSWNPGAERLFGYTRAEAIGRSITMLIPAEHFDEEPAILARIRRGERIHHYETVRRRKDGTLLDISLTVSPVRDARGVVVGASKIAHDITERKRMAEQREELLRAAERAREQAETANRAKDEFLAMLGHELRNPLSAVRNAVSVALLDEPNRARALEIAQRQAEQLSRIVDDLLDVARVTQGRVPLRRDRVTLAHVLQRAAEGARSVMEERGHTLTLHLPATPIHVHADSARMEQAVANLLANAAKYTNPGGTVSVTGEREGDEAVIRVRDNGLGIAPGNVERVFDLFAQGARSLDRGEGGLGIGLTVVRRIVELHGGTAQASSAGLGRGAEFVIRLPALSATAEEVAAASESGPKVNEGRPARVLMVEDQPDTAESLRLILELLGHHVRVVHDAPAALAAARANAPDIVLIDIGLPGMNGYELAQAIRSDPALKHLVLVALTGYGLPKDKDQALAAGFDYHLVKPVDLEALGELVARVGLQADPEASSTRH